jgi:hypothetical protein
MTTIKNSLLLAVLLLTTVARAADAPKVKGRIWAGQVTADPKDLNSTLTTDHVDNISKYNKFGADITNPVLSHLELGVRYDKIYQNNTGTNSINSATLNQDIVMGEMRIPIVTSTLLHADIFAAAGLSDSKVEFNTTTETGKLKTDGATGFASEAGATLGIGFKTVYLFVESGYISNKVQGMKKDSTLTNSVTSMDLSGSYMSIGLLIDGVSPSKK